MKVCLNRYTITIQFRRNFAISMKKIEILNLKTQKTTFLATPVTCGNILKNTHSWNDVFTMSKSTPNIFFISGHTYLERDFGEWRCRVEYLYYPDDNNILQTQILLSYVIFLIHEIPFKMLVPGNGFRTKYREKNIEVAKYRKQNMELVKYRMQNIEVAKDWSGKISKTKYRSGKISKAKYRTDKISNAKYRSGKISKNVYCWRFTN